MAEAAPSSLAGKRVVITRAALQSSELVEKLAERGAILISLPLVSFAAPQDYAPLDAALLQFENCLADFPTYARRKRPDCDDGRRVKDRGFHPVSVSYLGHSINDGLERGAFVRRPRKKQIPHPVQKPNGVRNDIFLSFSAGCWSRSLRQPGSAVLVVFLRSRSRGTDP